MTDTSPIARPPSSESPERQSLSKQRDNRLHSQFSGRVALVVGGGTGIGRAAACTFAAHGARVVVATRGSEQGLLTVRRIEEAGGMAALYCVDATSEAAIEGMISFVVATYGRLDMALNNVGHPGPLCRHHGNYA